MDILLLGRENSITQTIEEMINSVEEWNILTVSTLADAQSSAQSSQYDIILVKLGGFPTSTRTVIQKINAEFPDTPLLVIYFYSQPSLIKPLLKSGATGYLQEGLSEEKLFVCIRKVSDGEKQVFTENT